MFVNKIPFLVTVSRGLYFLTGENLPNRQAPTVAKALRRAVNAYLGRGFRISKIRADPEFQALEPYLPRHEFDYCGLVTMWTTSSGRSARSRTGCGALTTSSLLNGFLGC
jgi:hypothetical protein